MEYYELTYLALPSLKEEELEEVSKKIEELIKEGKLEKKERAKKQKLAYQIKDESQAFLVSLYFQAEAKEIASLEKYLKEEERVLRHLIIKNKPQKEEKKRSEKPSIFRSSQKPKVELSDIDKKIEEILEE